MDYTNLEEARLGFLLDLYKIEQRDKKDVASIICEDWQEVAEHIGISELDGWRVVESLQVDGLIDSMGGMHFALTNEGRSLIERALHDKSRGWVDKMKDMLMSPAVAGGAAEFVASIVVNFLTASDIPWWIKLIMGKK